MGGRAANEGQFIWTRERLQAFELLTAGCSATETARALHIGRRTLERWKVNQVFRARMDAQVQAFHIALWAKAHPGYET